MVAKSGGQLKTYTGNGYIEGWVDAKSNAIISSSAKHGYKLIVGTGSIQSVSAHSVIYLTSAPWTHNVTYSINGGEGDTPTGFTKTYGIPASIDVSNPVRAGYSFAGWKSSVTGTIYKKGDAYSHAQDGGTDTLVAQWEPNPYTFVFDANGGTGTMGNIVKKTGENITFPECLFTYAEDTAFLGWDTDSGTLTPTYKAGDIEDVLSIATDSGINPYDKTGIITLYAIWDSAPRISAEDRYFSLADANSGKITPDALFEKASCYDVEDGDIAPGEFFYLESYEKDYYINWVGNGSITETFVAKDSAGHSVRKTITIHIVDTASKENMLAENYRYTRFISLKYLDAATVDGGLISNSIWKKQANYNYLKNVLSLERVNPTVNTVSVLGLSVSKEVPGSGQWNGEIVQEWNFTRADIEKVKTFIDTHGMGNFREANALETFLKEFDYCKKK